MWKVDPPEHTAAFSYRTCTSRIQVKELRDRLKEAEDEVVAAADEYAEAAETLTLHTLEPGDFTLDTVSCDEMIALYKYRLVQKKAVGRFIYDDLILAATHGRCPLCGQRAVSTLDHHLPKTLYPALAVDPLNLIPACSDCNKLKSNAAPTCAEDEPLHPYFDDIEDDPWLCAAVVNVAPAAVRFYVGPPLEWPETLAYRAHRHFKMFKLASLYASQAAQEINNIRYALSQVFDRGGANEVQRHLEEQADSRRAAHINSWQTATYTALADSAWFCQGGFAE
ncbi:hypothetical protein [Streptomyces sp. SID12488]|uniref:HNH endonuclease n=1 Tax=Streptomyces sp. SID12488 TaxID=2706040 RepID=UPI0013DA455D|nr:hypothetical protein [Streptomyces sp. SID12488]NEA65316.1 hypothetical protein [Streptomyces sp. SID12488]